ncbi:MAG: hypothetical protein DRJ35_07365 [Thermoprotei archaeon]|nr:MAG: hypothetical protein DRJ35_07365 [Thermoprotei archaeon]
MKGKGLILGLTISSMLPFLVNAGEMPLNAERRWNQRVQAGLIDYEYSLAGAEKLNAATSFAVDLPLQNQMSVALRSALESQHNWLQSLESAEFDLNVQAGGWLANETAMGYVRGLVDIATEIKTDELASKLGFGIELGGAAKLPFGLVELSADYTRMFLPGPADNAEIKAGIFLNEAEVKAGLETDLKGSLEYSLEGLWNHNGLALGFEIGNDYGAVLIGYDFNGLIMLGRASTSGEYGLELRSSFDIKGN